MADIATQELHPRRPLLATHHWPLATNDRPLAAAFTLIEMLVVLGIIGLVVTLGVPLFGVLTGSKSQESAQNVVAAAIGQARTIAVNEGRYSGVLVYIDPASERTAVALVQEELRDPDPYDKYKSWQSGQKYEQRGYDTGTGLFRTGDRVMGLSADADATFRGPDYTKNPSPSTYYDYFGNYRPTVKVWKCIETHTAQDSSGGRPPRNGPYGPYAGSMPVPQKFDPPSKTAAAPPTPESTNEAFGNARWVIAGRVVTPQGQQLLPKGVGLQVLVEQLFLNSGSTTPTAADRYLRFGLIMFDSQGRLALEPFSIDPDAELSKWLGLPRVSSLRSGIGVVLYNDTLLRPQPFATEGDYTYRSSYAAAPVPMTFTGALSTTAAPAATLQDERTEETWLDNNASPLVINRFTGSLTQSE